MEENSASETGDRWVGVVADFNEPAICKIAVPHLLFFKPIRRIRGIDYDMLVVITTVQVIDPGISWTNRMERVVGTRRKGLIICIDGTDLEYSRRRAVVAFEFLRTTALTNQRAATPGKPMFAKKYGNRRSDRLPYATGFLKTLQAAMHAVPGWRYPNNELGD
jgi:hypothetical protein